MRQDEAYRLAWVIPDRIPSSEYPHIKTRMMYQIFEKQVFPHIQDGKTYGIKLDIKQGPAYDFYARDDVQIDMRLTMYQAEQRIMEYVDYRPMDWMTLSQTATEEIRHRLKSWWKRPLQARLYLWGLRLDAFERRHFGRAFDNRGYK
jgi:hypothetical protein